MTFKRSFFLSLAAIFALFLAFVSGYWLRDSLDSTGSTFPILNQAYQILVSNGIKEIPPQPALEYGMIKGMVQAYDDPYTVFVEPAQHELESDTLQGSFGGIGVRLGNDQQGYAVLFPFPEGPASQAGIRDGDRLLVVDNLNITLGLPVETIQAALRGKVGEKVQITVGRPPEFAPLKFSIQRAEIPLPSVTWHLDPDDPRLGVVEINVIAASTPDETLRAIQDLQSRGASAIALDLRDNYGGLLTAGVDTARLFLRDGVILQQQYRGKPVETYRVERPGPLSDLSLAVIVNQNTASAAEIIAGALKANGRAKLIGTHTYGKDTVQLVFELKDGSSLHVTSAHWWVPNLEPPLGGVGLQPDIPLSPEETNSEAAIRAAIALLFGLN